MKPHFSPLTLDTLFDGIGRQSFTSATVLYHYTDWRAAEGILRSQRFWATAFDATNDEEELLSANDTILEVARAMKREARSPAVLKAFNQFIRKYPESQIARVVPAYLTCFSQRRDDSTQWLKYSDSGRGLCLGLGMMNEDGPKNPEYTSALMQVNYSVESLRASLRKDWALLCSRIKHSGAPHGVKQIDFYVSLLNHIAAAHAISSKKPKWAPEEEIRNVVLAKSPSLQPQRREGAGREIRYLEILVRQEGKRIALAEVLIGSNQDCDASRERLTQLLAETGYSVGDLEYPKVVRSASPL